MPRPQPARSQIDNAVNDKKISPRQQLEMPRMMVHERTRIVDSLLPASTIPLCAVYRSEIHFLIHGHLSKYTQ